MKKLLVLALLALTPMTAVAQDRSDEDIKRLALEAILERPEILMQAIQLLDQREAAAQRSAAAKVLEQERDLLENDPNAPVLGNPDGDAVVIEFFDYNCPYCKRVAPDVKALVEHDEDLKVVYREWPILGDGSVFAARAALASREQGLYEPFHWALMELAGRADEATVMAAAEDVGLDTDKLRDDMDAAELDQHIETSMRLAQLLGFNGTPSFVIGDELVPGLVPLERLEDLVEAARQQ
ncbi:MULTISPECIES: DsbA family protein [Roseobacteraceae]|uniref:Disulfide bond formation protein D n=2 Tax=Roseobacteraceae TaxID=2854170 RepID=A0A2R8BQZ7_9RHOB|nr:MULTISPECIES: DsbA family protein [Roseobacteraceae]MDT0684065.1 DsbA family protein [Roseicyclus sp. F158]SPJ22528.1 Disulfide bond formation protein D [Palleronia abyssalis]